MNYFPEEIALIENDETTNFFRRIFYCWTNDLVKKGYRKQLNLVDNLCALPGSLDTTKIYDQLPAPRHQDFSLAKFLFSKYGTTFILLGILKLFGDIVRFMNLILLPVLIDSFDKEKSIEDYSGFKIASLMGLILFVSAVADFNFNFLVNKIALQIRTATQLIVYEKLLRVSSVSFAQANFTTGKLLNLVSTDIDRAVNFFTSFHSFWSMPLNLCIALFLLYREVNIAFISGLISAAILIPINKIVADMIGKMSRKMMNLKDERLKLVNEFVRSTKAVKLNNWERFFEHKITAVRNEELKYLKWRKYLDAICVYMWASAPVVITLSILVTFVLLGGELTAAKIFTSISLVNVLIYPLNAFPWVLNSMIEALVSKRRFDSLLSLKEIEDFAIISDNLSTGKFLLRLNDVSFSWTNERLIIRNLKLSAEKGQVIGIMGPVGSGKSTILQGILGETLHRAIDDIFAQKPIEFCRDAIANGIGYVGQESWLRQGTVKENILSGSEYDPEFYSQVIHACALVPDIEAMPGRDELMLSNNGGNLSGGQRTRIELARAVYQRCGIYVLDDPFASVDSEVAQHIFRRCIKGMLKQSGAVVILCTHHTNFLTEVDWLLKLGQDGSVIQQGTPKEIFAPDHIARCDFALSIEASQINNTNSASADQELGPEAIVSEHVEEKQQGTVKIGIYIVYIRAVGIFLTVAILLSLTAMQLTKNGSDAWLGYWTGHSANATMELSRTLTFMLPDSRIINFLNPLYFNGWSEQISSTLKQFTGGMDRQSDHFYLMVYVIIAISNTFCTLARAFLFAYGGLVGARVLHQRLLRRVSMAKLTWWDKHPFGRVINRLSSDVFMVDDSLPFQMNILLAMAFNLFGTLLIMCIALPIIIPVIVALSVGYYFLQNYYRHTTVELKRITAISLSPLYSHVTDTVAGLVSIRAHRFSQRFLSMLCSRIQANIRAQYSQLACSQWLSVRLQCIGVLIVTLVALGSVIESKFIGMHTGLMSLAITYALSFTNLLNGLLSSFIETEKELVSVERINEYIETIPAEEENDGGEQKIDPPLLNWNERIKGRISFIDVNLSYNPGLPNALRDVSFDVKPGMRVAIVGRTGSGKSSIFQALLRSYPIKSGKIYIDGVHDIEQLNMRDLRSLFGYVSQAPFLFSGTVRENLCLNRCEIIEDCEIESVMRDAGMGEWLQRVGGLNAELIEAGKSLSLGEKQLICLCRLILSKPKIVLIDEGTAHVDEERHIAVINELLRLLHSETTVLSIVHRRMGLDSFDWIIEMANGSIISQGPSSSFPFVHNQHSNAGICN